MQLINFLWRDDGQPTLAGWLAVLLAAYALVDVGVSLLEVSAR